MIRGLDGGQIVITKWYANQNPFRHTDECVTYVQSGADVIHFQVQRDLSSSSRLRPRSTLSPAIQ